MKFKQEIKMQRMYCLVLRHLSPINKGIQCTHACEQYGEKYRKEEDYIRYIHEDKTLIMLEGGTSPDMDEIEKYLLEKNVQHYAFREPDLNNLVTAICFLVDERVWDGELFEKTLDDAVLYGETDITTECIGGTKNLAKGIIIKGKRLAS